MRSRNDKWLILSLLILLLLPLVSMYLLPFSDTSEPRYAEIARLMAQSGDWITPWFTPTTPFWGKPPLSFWAQAGSMKLFGVNEFAARFPSWICTLIGTWLLYVCMRRLRGRRVALWTVLIYNSCTLVYVTSGAVLTDPFLVLGTIMSMVSFAMMVGQPLIHPDQNRHDGVNALASMWWGYAFFVGLSIGLLAKGPLAAVLIFAPLVLWSILNRRFPSNMPWVKGFVLTAVLSLPWYILAEIKTPGFIDYFIVGEHFRRFIDPGWQGDLYGTAHREHFGIIWLNWLEATFPWGLMVLVGIVGACRNLQLRTAFKEVLADPLRSYWLAWALFTPVFFTVSANILWTYLLPAIPAFSIVAAIVLDSLLRQSWFTDRRLLPAIAVVPVVVLVLTVFVWAKPDTRNSERTLVRYVAAQSGPDRNLRYLGKPPFSAQFYSDGSVGQTTLEALGQSQAQGASYFLALRKKDEPTVARVLGHPLVPVFHNRRYILIKLPQASSKG